MREKAGIGRADMKRTVLFACYGILMGKYLRSGERTGAIYKGLTEMVV